MFSNICRKMQQIHMREKVFVLFVAGTLGAMLLQGILFNWYSSSIICQQAREMGQSTLQNLQDDMYQQIKSIENSMIGIYDNRELIHMLAQEEYRAAEEDKNSSAAYKLAIDAFDPTQNVVAIYIYTQNHELVSSYRHAQTPKYTYPQDIYASGIYNNSDQVRSYIESTDTQTFISSYYNPYREKILLRFVIRIYEDIGIPIGYLVCDIDSSNVQQMMEKYHYSEREIIWLQASGHPILLQVGTISEQQQDMLHQIQTDIETGQMKQSDQLNGYELIQVPQKKYPVTAYSLIPWSTLFESQKTLTQMTIFIFLLVLGLFSVLFIMLSNSLTKPLRYMMDVMHRVQHGNTELRLNMTRKDEIGELGDAFDRMLNEIQLLNARKYRDKMRLNDAKYKALQAQVNPHFLYNTLDTMGGIAVSHDCFQVSALCRALSDIFRYSLDMKDPFSTLEKELFHLKNYMFVINERMQNTIMMRVNVDPALLKARLPRLSLQPLVENAIKHGLKDKRGEKQIQVQAEVNDGTLCITVSDNGVGMDVDAVNKKLAHSEQKALRRGSSIGMDNINARIQILFGKQYGLRVKPSAEGGSCVQIHLPYLKENPRKDQTNDI